MLNSIELPLSSSLLHNSPFREKTYNSENLGRKSLLLAIEHFSLDFEITQWNGKPVPESLFQ